MVIKLCCDGLVRLCHQRHHGAAFFWVGWFMVRLIVSIPMDFLFTGLNEIHESIVSPRRGSFVDISINPGASPWANFFQPSGLLKHENSGCN